MCHVHVFEGEEGEFVSGHSSNIYGVWRSKEVGLFKVIIEGGNASRKVGEGREEAIFMENWGFLLH